MSGRSPLVVAIDGPSGVGKSSVARKLARRLGVPFLDTGAMYRAVALKVLESGADPADADAVASLSESADIRLERRDDGTFAVLLDGRPVEGRIRSREVSEAASQVSEHPAVRRRMVALQREIAGRHGGVLEGRDIGTRVFPETPHKFFLDAHPEVRFRRRHDQLAAAGRPEDYGAVVEEITARDQRDSRRTDSPLTRDPSYTFIDSSDLDLDEVVERMARQIEEAEAPSAL
ncbi:MAG: (d)CMP kinase [Thermoanaerobaculia bacterium]